MIFDLVKDYAELLDAMPKTHPRRRILKLLDEAIRRDVHFIDRHPTTFFQCMWKTCWWYDCDEAAEHYEEPDGGWATQPPWRRSGRISSQLQRWNAEKSAATPGFRWLRSARPPPIPLDSGLRFTFNVSDSSPLAITATGDFALCAVASTGHTFEVYDLHEGITLFRDHLRDGSPTAIAFSRNGRWLAVGTLQGAVRIYGVGKPFVVAEFDVSHGAVTSLSFNKDASKIAVAADDVTICSVPDGSIIDVLQRRDSSDRIVRMTFTDDESHLVGTLCRHHVPLDGYLDLRTTRLTGYEFSSYRCSWWSLADGTTIDASGSSYGGHSGSSWNRMPAPIPLADGIHVLHVQSERRETGLPGSNRKWVKHQLILESRRTGEDRLLVATEEEIHAIAVSDDEQTAVLVHPTSATVCDVRSATKLFTAPIHSAPQDSLCISNDGRELVVCGASGVRIWDLADQRVRHPPIERFRYVLDAVLTPDGRWLATRQPESRFGATLRVWSVDDGLAVLATESDHDTVSSSAIGNISVLSEPDRVSIRDASGGLELASIEVPVGEAGLTPDGRWLLGMMGGQLAIIDVEETLAGARLAPDASAGTRDIAMTDTRQYRTTPVFGGELTVESDRRPTAWFPDVLEQVTRTGRVVAGARDGHVFILHLEGSAFLAGEQADNLVEENLAIEPQTSAGPLDRLVHAVRSFFRCDEESQRGSAASGPS